MSLVTGNALDSQKFFSHGQPAAQGSSFDLTIGAIYDSEGNKLEGHFTIKPGHMVQVVSSEVFRLSDRITGHVTYKTTLTKRGIWALTVGIIDPGWEGPIATTLLNFSRVDHTITKGDAFLRVSFFEHDPVPADKLRDTPSLDEYLKEIQKTASSTFPATFLDTKKIAEDAGEKVLDRIRKEALVWVGLIVILFTFIQLAFNFSRGYLPTEVTRKDIEAIRAEMESLQKKLPRTPSAADSAPGGSGARVPLSPPLSAPAQPTPQRSPPSAPN
jgi:deoxycytidine triphosphate deaminase